PRERKGPGELSMSPLLLLASAEPEGWHYAAWVAIDVRLLVLVLLVSLLTAAGICALAVRTTRKVELAAAFLLCFSATFVVSLLIFNEIAHYPVFVVESLFAFP